MKILILTQNIKNRPAMIKGLEIAKELALKEGLNLEYTFQETEKVFSSFSFVNDVQPKGVALNGWEIIQETKGDYTISCLIYDWDKYNPKPTNPITQGYARNLTVPIHIPEQWYNGYPEVLAEFFLHELCHAGFFLANKIDTTHNFYQSNFKNLPGGPTLYYLSLLKDLKSNLEKNIMTNYTYFSPKEVSTHKLSPKLFELLDKMRGAANTPFVITSGFRTPEQNVKAKGQSNSSHLKGLAVDLRCNDNFTRAKMLAGILPFKDQIFIEIADKHIHIDIDSSIHKLGQVILGESY